MMLPRAQPIARQSHHPYAPVPEPGSLSDLKPRPHIRGCSSEYKENVAARRCPPLWCENTIMLVSSGSAAASRTASWPRGVSRAGAVKESRVPGAISWPACCAAAGEATGVADRSTPQPSFSSSNGLEVKRHFSPKSMVRCPPTPNSPTCSIHLLEYTIGGVSQHRPTTCLTASPLDAARFVPCAYSSHEPRSKSTRVGPRRDGADEHVIDVLVCCGWSSTPGSTPGIPYHKHQQETRASLSKDDAGSRMGNRKERR